VAKVALLVGVSEYQPGFQKLPSAIKDIQAMEMVLKEKGEFDDVKTLDNPDPQKIQEEIYQLFNNRTSEDLVLFYFSGHGVKDHNRKFYLTTSQTSKGQDKKLKSHTAIAASYLQERMTDSRSERQVIILDCCYAAAFAQGLTVKGDLEIDILAELGGKGRAILTSSNSTQESYTQDDLELSIYTHYLVEGIETGAADRDGDGKISVDELHEYTSKRVQEASPAMTPQFYPVEEGYKIYVARSPINDPKLKYRKEAEKYIHKGEFTNLGRLILNELQTKLGLSQEEANAIETELLQPYREYQQKLQKYEQAFREEVVEGGDLISERTRNELKDYQTVLGLRDEDIAPIEARLAPQLAEDPTNKPKPPEQPSNLILEVSDYAVVTVNNQGQEINRNKGQAKYLTEDLGNGVTLDIVYIPGGEFLMGTEDEEIERLVQKYNWEYFRKEKPQHKVTVPSFFMGKYPITQAQWKVIANRTDLRIKLDLSPEPSAFKNHHNRPVEQVSWYDAVEFCTRLSKLTKQEYRLPSEAEWEYACRAGTTTPFYFGETITTNLANYNGKYIYADEPQGTYRGNTLDVGSFLPNAFGLYDMHGNVWEWCYDTWHSNYNGAPVDGSAWTTGEDNNSSSILRGGSWDGNTDYCRSANRHANPRVNIYNNIGFRVVCVFGRT
jgi:formylglycine-generating enzyme required for sulfatase activity